MLPVVSDDNVKEDAVAPLTLDHVVPESVDTCHWYAIVDVGSVAAAATENVADPPTFTLAACGCAEIVSKGNVPHS
ncbi:MAG: hypothetical protein EBR82_53485 [Caulobacteraceae bacterium]|nr:hypothetical protein [Caulobacteraceae bacterium]